MEVRETRNDEAVEAPPTYPPPVGTPVVSPNPAPVSGSRYVRTSYVSSAPVGYRARQLVWLAFGIVAAFLVLDLAFHAAGANTASSFVTFVYNVGGAFNMPFRNIITGQRPGVSTIEWADVIALAVYAVAAWIVERAIAIMRTPTHPATY